jgi:two-component system nitrate/nitrite response regulator NarL
MLRSFSSPFSRNAALYQGRIETMKKKLVLVESHPVMHLGLYGLLSGFSNEWAVVSLDLKELDTSGDPDQAADLVVLGLPHDPREGFEALAAIETFMRPKRTLLLSEPSAQWSPAYSVSTLGVYACIEKTASTQAILAAVKLGMRDDKPCSKSSDVAVREKPWPPPFQLVNRFSTHKSVRWNIPVAQRCVINTHTLKASVKEEPLRLTPRQQEVLKLLACGHPIKTVSRMMAISTATAKAHTASLYRQLKVNSRDEAVHIARLKGALPH